MRPISDVQQHAVSNGLRMGLLLPICTCEHATCKSSPGSKTCAEAFQKAGCVKQVQCSLRHGEGFRSTPGGLPQFSSRASAYGHKRWYSPTSMRYATFRSALLNRACSRHIAPHQSSINIIVHV